MALVHFDSFGGYTGITIPVFSGTDKLFSITGLHSYAQFNAAGRYGGKSLSTMFGNYNTLFTLTTPISGIIVGIALKCYTEGTPTYNASKGIIIGLLEGSTYHLKLHLVGTEIQVRDGANGLLGTTSGANITYNAWSYIEVKAVIHDSTGSVVIRVGETEVLSLSSIDTKNGGTGVVSVISFSCANVDIRSYHSDLYICDLTGDAPCNDFLGDVRVDQLLPNGAGTYTQFTPSAGANYQNVDEAGYHDADTTYNETDTVGNKDSYAVADLPSPPAGTTIYGVRNVAVLRKTDVGVRTAKQLLITGATETLGTERTLSDSDQIFSELSELNPADSEPFEDADINAIEPGVEVAS